MSITKNNKKRLPIFAKCMQFKWPFSSTYSLSAC